MGQATFCTVPAKTLVALALCSYGVTYYITAYLCAYNNFGLTQYPACIGKPTDIYRDAWKMTICWHFTLNMLKIIYRACPVQPLAVTLVHAIPINVVV